MADDALYIADDGEIKLFEGHSEQLATVAFGEKQDTGIVKAIWYRVELDDPLLERGIRRLLAEREEARDLACEMYEGSIYDPLGWRVKYPWLTEGDIR